MKSSPLKVSHSKGLFPRDYYNNELSERGFGPNHLIGGLKFVNMLFSKVKDDVGTKQDLFEWMESVVRL